MIEFLGEVVAWFGQEGRWFGDGGIGERTLEHLALALVPILISVALALPAAVWLAHRRIGEFSTSTVVSIGRAVPSFGLLVLAALFFLRAGVSLRFWPAVVALVALAVPPIFTNAYTSIAGVEVETVEAARAMGLTESEILWSVEIPLGSPVILAGVRIALIQVLATVPLASVLSSGGGLGQYVIRGFAQGPAGTVEVFSGAVLIAALTLVAGWLFTLGESALLPEGVRRMSVTEARASATIS